ncbi:hypothetical protein DPEC_G00063910 [Dallia pectoralis]|uniref:Uncharacterized protein n=1 Tax=Dallia pectoralis TaxID=75939 RepID=A0ACC2H8B0_DALPE|nr:hypothetical protein DPEC_G00063910 [Dallia pectoralis]
MTEREGRKKKVSLYDSQAPICPICQVLLRPGELQDHMEQEMERLTHMNLSKNSSHGHKDGSMAPGTPKSMLLSVHIKREGESPVVSPLSSEDAHHSDRYQVSCLTFDLTGETGLEITTCVLCSAVCCC